MIVKLRVVHFLFVVSKDSQIILIVGSMKGHVRLNLEEIVTKGFFDRNVLY